MFLYKSQCCIWKVFQSSILETSHRLGNFWILNEAKIYCYFRCLILKTEVWENFSNVSLTFVLKNLNWTVFIFYMAWDIITSKMKFSFSLFISEIKLVGVYLFVALKVHAGSRKPPAFFRSKYNRNELKKQIFWVWWHELFRNNI